MARSKTSVGSLLKESGDDAFQAPSQPGMVGIQGDSGEREVLGGTACSSEDESYAVSPDVPIDVDPVNPATLPSQLHSEQRILDGLAAFRAALVTNHAQNLAMLDQELQKVQNSLAEESLPLGPKRGSKTSTRAVKLPGALNQDPSYPGRTFGAFNSSLAHSLDCSNALFQHPSRIIYNYILIYICYIIYHINNKKNYHCKKDNMLLSKETSNIQHKKLPKDHNHLITADPPVLYTSVCLSWLCRREE